MPLFFLLLWYRKRPTPFSPVPTVTMPPISAGEPELLRGAVISRLQRSAPSARFRLSAKQLRGPGYKDIGLSDHSLSNLQLTLTYRDGTFPRSSRRFA